MPRPYCLFILFPFLRYTQYSRRYTNQFSRRQSRPQPTQYDIRYTQYSPYLPPQLQTQPVGFRAHFSPKSARPNAQVCRFFVLIFAHNWHISREITRIFPIFCNFFKLFPCFSPIPAHLVAPNPPFWPKNKHPPQKTPKKTWKKPPFFSFSKK